MFATANTVSRYDVKNVYIDFNSFDFESAVGNSTMFVDPTGEFGQTVQGAPSGGHGPMGGMGQSLGDAISQPNGNVWGKPGPQDNVCSLGPVFGPIGDACVPDRCQKHDDCYADNGCTASSWVSSALGGTKSCNQCNSGFFQ
jgi:hypothetical protein